jgi:hypothetical protein
MVFPPVAPMTVPANPQRITTMQATAYVQTIRLFITEPPSSEGSSPSVRCHR